MEFEVHWGQHPLRPELVESTYFLFEVWNQTWFVQYFDPIKLKTFGTSNVNPVNNNY